MLNLPSSTTAVLDTVSASTVPRHTDEKATIVTEVGRPVVLAVGLGEDVSQCMMPFLWETLFLPAGP